MLEDRLKPSNVLPFDHRRGVLVGRVWIDGLGAVLVQVRDDGLFDLSDVAATCSALIELDYPAQAVRNSAGARLGDTAAVLANSAWNRREKSMPWFLAPIDLQAIKAAGVTFVSSMLERVIEEQARGDPGRAEDIRKAVVAAVGDDLAKVVPGSPEADKVKQALVQRGAWSQYLEVGIGPDAEVFTKAQPMSAVGVGAEIGIHPRSAWNNPEPEIVLIVNSHGVVKGATLGNDVNLRDFEGRSALLLGKAKDNNASCAIGPFIRLFDPDFGMQDVRQCDLSLRVTGPHEPGQTPYQLKGASSMKKISRDPIELVRQSIGDYHQYPDGFALFLGTMFAPTDDRLGPGQGFTHLLGDEVVVSTPQLGALVNVVNHSDRIAPWTYGTRALMQDLARRRLL